MSKKVNSRIQNKHDTAANWKKATGFQPLEGELIIYDTDSTYDYPRFKIGDGNRTADELPFTVNPHTHDEKANIADLKITGTVTKALGGIAKDKTYTDADIADVLSDLLFPYVAPTMSSITLSEAAGTFEYGTSKTVSKVTPNFTKGSKAITSVKIGTTSGGKDLYEGTLPEGNTINLTTSKTYDDTTGGGTIYCTISDGTQSVSKSASISFTYYNYVIVTASTDKPTSKGSSGSNLGTSAEVNSLTTTDGSYIWFLMPNQNKNQIQEYAMNQWNNVNTTAEGSVDFTTDTGKQVTYYAYRTDKMMSNTSKYRIN